MEYGKVLTTLSKYGNVIVTGSYKYDLMYAPDIDLVVTTDDPDKSSYQALIDFIDQRKFQKYQLGDFLWYPRDGRPKAIIIVLIHEYKGRRWEIEVWFDKQPPKGDVDDELEDLLMKITDEQRETILNLKCEREKQDTSNYKLDSATIYKGVILEGKNNPEDFKI